MRFRDAARILEPKFPGPNAATASPPTTAAAAAATRPAVSSAAASQKSGTNRPAKAITRGKIGNICPPSQKADVKKSVKLLTS